MTEKELRILIELICQLASSSEGSWADRKDKLLDEATEDEIPHIIEFASWFEGE